MYALISGSTTVAYVERYDVDSSEWYDAHPMILNRSALRACVLAGLPNARQYSYLSVIQETGKGASSNNTSH
jgi:kelch-like protein 10